jgi:translation initiation factor 2B subunit (eIF-2B alpha/beta/delta family)
LLKQKVCLDPTRDTITSKVQQTAASLKSVESTTTTIAPKEMLEAYMRLIESEKTEKYRNLKEKAITKISKASEKHRPK